MLCHIRVVASFEQGAISRSTIIASTKSRSRVRLAPISLSSPIRRIVSSTAST